MKPYEELIRLLRGHEISLQTHNFPDPDAIGSVFGLQYFLKQYGINSRLVYDGKIDKISTKKMVEFFNIEINSVDSCDELKETDYVITVDGQKNNSNFTDIVGDEVACIDHHPYVTKYNYRFVDHRLVGACSSIIVSYYIESGLVPTEDVATALLYGIKSDTNNFSRGVTELDITAFQFLHKYINTQKLRNIENNTVELSDLRAYGVAFQNTVVYDKVGFAHINFDCPDALIAMVSDFILSLDAVEVSVIYADRDGGYKFSVRSEDEVINSGKLISRALKGVGFGGGHPTMAGGVITKDLVKGLGEDHDFEIRKRFMDAESQMFEEAALEFQMVES